MRFLAHPSLTIPWFYDQRHPIAEIRQKLVTLDSDDRERAEPFAVRVFPLFP